MSVTFLRLWENMQDGDSPLNDSGIESPAMRVIRSGNSIRGEGKNPFWEDFLQVINDAEGIADLLAIRPDQIRTWSKRIHHAMESVKKADSKDGQKNEMLPTGDQPKLNPGDSPRSQGIPAQF